MTDSIEDRLKQARKQAGFETAADAARAFGWKEPTYLGHENGSRGLSRAAKDYAKAYRVSLQWLLLGDGPMMAQDARTARGGLKGREASTQLAHDLAPIPEIDIRAGAGPGGDSLSLDAFTEGDGYVVSQDVVRAEWQIPPEYMTHELRVERQHARIVDIVGDSMSPTLESGDRVMINIADRRPSPGGIFALWDGLGVVIKRIEHIPNTEPAKLRISSDNPRHETYERTIDEVRIIGRARWLARRM